MNLTIEFDDDLFFDRLQGMQLDEQEEVLRRRINELKESKLYTEPNGRKFNALSSSQRKCEAELHRVAQVNNRGRWSDAVRNLFGQEGYEAVRMEIERMHGFPYGDKHQRGAA
jgi:hypothetical protein